MLSFWLAATGLSSGTRAIRRPMSDPALTRRQLLASGLAVGARLTLDPLARRPRPARLGDIERVVIMIQENRSFDHYFGRYRGVRGFGDRSARGVLGQPDGQGGTIYPFHVPARRTGGGCTADPDHLWGAQHESVLTPGAWVTSHRSFNGHDAPVSMGYFDRRDIPYYFALARGSLGYLWIPVSPMARTRSQTTASSSERTTSTATPWP